MNTDIWRKLWAFLNQPLFDQSSANLQRLERCWDMPYNQDIQFDLQLLERCWNKSCIKPECDR
ncbi:hypothetical protein H1Q63_08975 [Desmonostoc muscorum CCALA 125]|uniref:Uncharacterized protein n=1 Tax=Nostoc paludosum FACHB-159 TaxID=2692908 RepID=A0ABR8KK58_9NOSO|nr:MULTISPECIES: hypothetical protein [Nostoc]MBD2682838.1 hypothetical protein [Nostoc sp. FACHB-857]MBD2739173.1 hypothetical protein [Nostoc paludosum FACHB-159]MBX9254078.1 hypothetical protein [Desmonostoc muscorum CCALA 125]